VIPRWVRTFWVRRWVRRVAGLLVVVAALATAAYSSEATGTKVPLLIMVVVLGVVVGVVTAFSRRDAVSLLTVVLVPLFLVPANFSIAGPLKSVGYPPMLAGLACLVVWAVARWTGAVNAEPMHPWRWTVLVFVVVNFAAYAAAMMRVLVQQETDSANRQIFPVLAMIGITMLATDGLTTRQQVERLLKRLVVLATVEGVIGALEYFLKIDYRSIARLPGLALNTDVVNATRSGFSRIAASAANPLELSVVIAMTVPLAIHFAVNASTSAERRRWLACVAVLVAVVPLTVSRSGLLTLALGVAIYGAILTGRARANLIVLSAFGLVLFPAIAPGILGTLRNFIFAGTNDDSITGRLDDYQYIPGLLDGHWWFGRGFATFEPTVYFFLDNQYLMSLITGGIVGLIVFVSLFIVGASVARGARKRFTVRSDRDLAQAIAAAIVAVGATAATLDLFSFLQATFVLFLLAGCGAALWTVARYQAADRDIPSTEGTEAGVGTGAAIGERAALTTVPAAAPLPENRL
jgi:hypothetical protein